MKPAKKLQIRHQHTVVPDNLRVQGKGWATGILWYPLQAELLYSSVVKSKNPHGTKLLSHYKGSMHQQKNVFRALFWILELYLELN